MAASEARPCIRYIAPASTGCSWPAISVAEVAMKRTSLFTSGMGRRSPSGARPWLVLSAALVCAAIGFCHRGTGARPAVTSQRPLQAAVSDGASIAERHRLRRHPVSSVANGERKPFTGRVTTVGGRPIASANVCLIPAGATCCAAWACATTDRSGQFALDEGVWGASQLSASAAGFLPLRRPVSEAEGDLVLVLRSGGATIAGSVVDASGGPIANAFLVARAAGSSHDLLDAVGLTDPSGNFSVTVLPGALQLFAEADGYSGVQRFVDAPQNDVRLVMVAASSLEGHVFDEATQQPLGAVDVTVFNQSRVGGLPRTVSTDPKGAFRVDALPAGAYSVLAVSDQWRSEERWVSLGVAERQSVDLIMRPAGRLRGIVEVAGSGCPAGNVALDGPFSDFRDIDENGEVDFRSIPLGSYRATVSCTGAVQLSETLEVELEPLVRTWQLNAGITLSGLVTTFTGMPLAGGQVVVSPITSPLDRSSVSCVSDARGEFSCSGLLPGEYECQLRSDSTEMSDRIKVSVSVESSPKIILRSHAGGILRVRLAASTPLQLGALSVVAKGERASMLLARQESDGFVFDPMPLGRYMVALDPAVSGADVRVDLVRAGEAVEVTLPSLVSRTLAGRVVDEEGHGVPDAWVRVAGASPNAQARPAAPVLTDAEGAFTVEGLLPAQYQVDVNSPRGEGRRDDVSASDSVTVTLRTYGSLSGSVSTPRGAPVHAFTVSYAERNSGAMEQVFGSDGTWSMPWLAPGTYELDVTASEGVAHATVNIVPGSEATLAVSLIGGGATADP